MKKTDPARQKQQQQLLPVMWRKKNAISWSWSLDQGLDLVFKFVVSLLKVQLQSVVFNECLGRKAITDLISCTTGNIYDFFKKLHLDKPLYLGLPRWHSGKESTCQCRRLKRCGFNSQIKKTPGGGNGNSFQYSCLENSMDRGVWRATVHGVTKSWDMTEVTTLTQYFFMIKTFRKVEIEGEFLNMVKCVYEKFTSY